MVTRLSPRSIEVSAEQYSNALVEIVLTESGSITDSSAVQRENACSPTVSRIVAYSEMSNATSVVQFANA